jgi:hypothetical protein
MLRVEPISAQLAREVVEREHYLHRKPPASHSFGLFEEGELVGVVIFAPPGIHEVKLSVCPEQPELVLELNRLWVDDRMPRNTESWFVSRALKQLPASIVVSYADTKEERGETRHFGYIYRALNFNYAGWTDMERKTARWDYIPASGNHSRDSFRNGQKTWTHRVRRLPKVKYWTVTGNRSERRKLTALCRWPILRWQDVPPPAAHQQLKLAAD